jgi:GNAT superfamily N-acetyltransferase
MGIEVASVPGADLAAPLTLLEEALRDGESLPGHSLERLRSVVEKGDLEVLAARAEGRTVGVAVISYRPNVSAAADFASVEELYVRPEARSRDVGRALLEAVEEQCAARGVSYVEVQTDDQAAAFYAALGYEEESGVRVMARSLIIGQE